MRDIKFRVWDEKYNCWDNTTNFYYYADCSIILQGRIFQQYIGLKDINGKDIYEGDIIEYIKKNVYSFDLNIKKIGEVFWAIEDLGFRAKELTSGFRKGRSIFKFENSSFSQVKVIGNIFDNPELIEKEVE